jgi:trigger factor
MKLTVQVESQTIAEARQRAARKISKQTKIPGFRPGKAPYNVIHRTVGESAIFEEAVEILATDLYPKIIEEAGIDPYGPGQLENITSMDPLTLVFMVPLDAEVTLGEYHDIRFTYDQPVIEEKDVQRVIDDLRERQAVITPVERPAAEGDQVTIKLSAVRKQVGEGEETNLLEERSTTINIRNASVDSDDEWPFPGFSRNLIGLSTSDESRVSYIYPKDSEWETLQGQEAEFLFSVEAVKTRELPEANDAFAKTVGEYETLKDLTKEIRESLEEQALNDYKADYHQQIVTELVKEASIKYPPQMLEHEIHLYIDQLENRLAQQGLDLETYLKARQMDEKALHEEVKPLADERLKRTLVLFKVARQENISVTNEEIESESSQTLAHMSKYMTPDQAKKAISEGYIRNLVGNISTDLLIRRTYERLEAIAKGEYNPEEKVTEEKVETLTESVESPLPKSPESTSTPDSPTEEEKVSKDNNTE